MHKILKYFIIIPAITLMLSNYAQAQQASKARLEALFTINSIAVDETARNASIARSQAISTAESIAFDKLKSKLVAIDDLHLLSNTDFLDIQSLVHSIEVREERAFSNRYMAKINISFNPDSIIDIFTKAGASFILNAGADLCVAHGHKQGLITYLWEPDNLAKSYWQDMDLINRLRNYKIAQGTLQERKSLNAQTIESGGFEVAETFGKGCGSGAGLIVFTQLTSDATTGDTGLRYQYWISDMHVSGEGTLRVPDDEPADGVMTLLINQIINSSDEIWRQTAMVRGDEKAEILFLLHTDQITALAQAQQKLASLSSVSNVTITRIAIPLSELRVSYTGTRDQMMQAINQIGYTLEAWGQENLLVPLK